MEKYNIIFLSLFGLGFAISLVRILCFHLKKNICNLADNFQEALKHGDYWLMAVACFLLVFFNQDHKFFIRDVVWVMGLLFSFVIPYAVHGIVELIVLLAVMSRRNEKDVEPQNEEIC